MRSPVKSLCPKSAPHDSCRPEIEPSKEIETQSAGVGRATPRASVAPLRLHQLRHWTGGVDRDRATGLSTMPSKNHVDLTTAFQQVSRASWALTLQPWCDAHGHVVMTSQGRAALQWSLQPAEQPALPVLMPGPRQWRPCSLDYQSPWYASCWTSADEQEWVVSRYSSPAQPVEP